MAESKVCRVCGECLPFDMFGKSDFLTSGYKSTCFGCRAAQKRDAQAKYKKTKKGRKTDKKWRHGEAGKISRKNSQDKTGLASSYINMLVKNGVLPNQKDTSCIMCGGKGEHYHHYNGYGKDAWGDVVSVCAVCHYSIHHKK